MKKITLLTLLLFAFLWQGNTQIFIQEDFDSGVPSDWTKVRYSNSTTPAYQCGDGTGSVFNNMYGSSSNDGTLISPNYVGVSNGTDTTVQFDWLARPYSVNAVDYIMYIDYSTNDGADWISISSFAVTETTPCTAFTEVIPAADLATGSDFKFRIRGEWQSGDSYFYLDNLNISQVISCPSPSDLLGADITATTAALSWTENGSATSWNIEVVDITAGATFTGTPTTSNVTNPYTVTGLASDNDYEYYVQADCTGGDLSSWVGPFTFSTIPTCLSPTDLEVSNITTSSAELSWSAGDAEVLWNIEVVNITSGGSVSGTPSNMGVTNPFVATGLLTSSEYEFYVQADCGNNDTSEWVGPFTFSTLCEPIASFPWTEDFEAVTTPNLPICWDINNNNDDTDFWKTYGTYGTSGGTAVGLYTDYNYGSNDDYLILPQFTLTGNERLIFNVRARSTGEPNDYKVVLSTTGTAPEDFTTDLSDLTQVSSTSYEEKIINLNAYSGDVYIAIHVPEDGLDGYYIYFDDFSIVELPSCIEPTNLTASAISSDQANLSWTEEGTASLYNVEVLIAGETPTGVATDTGVSNSFTKTGLSPITSYEFYVQAECTGGDLSAWVGPYSFTTSCVPYAAPFMENFDGVGSSEVPSCWSTIENSSSSYASVLTNTSYDISEPNSMRFYNGSDTDAELILISPNFNDDFTLNRVRFSGRDGAENDFIVGTITDPTDASSFTPFQTITLTSTQTEYSVNFDTYTGTDSYIALKMVPSSTYNYTYIDNFYWEAIPNCTQAVVESSAIFEDCENTQYYVDVNITTLGDATEVSDGTNTFAISGTGIAHIGPFASGDSTTLTITHSDSACDLNLGTFHFACPPTNDECSAAQSITQETGIANASSATATPGTIDGATDSGLAAEECGIFTGNANDDVWYSFVALTEDVNITYELSTGFDGVAELFSGTCGALTIIGCSDNSTTEEVNATGLTVGETYYTRIFQYSGSVSTIGKTFDLKIWSQDEPLGVSDFETEAAFTYYPNPVKNTLSLNAQNTIEQVAMYNMLGQEVLRATPNTVDSDLDMSQLQTGTYFVKVTIANVTKTIRVMKQ